MLNWPVLELMKYKDTPLHFNETLDLKKDLMTRDPEIMDVTPIKVDGYIAYDKGDFVVSATLNGSMIVPSTRSLTPVTLPTNLSFSEIYLGDPAHADQYEDGELLIELEGDRLDLVPAIEDHILLSIPMQILTPEEAQTGTMPAGEDWNVISEDEYAQTHDEADERPNAEFEKLKDLFKDDDTE
ncbi:YceD family protein [Lacticaseibacillus brantae]|uniref:Metal-binding protein n=1 Tax=Lacticaseibacillus brantae DSM 23927 TaxID=1423727 RepID=A0A0R2B008_9LACO|nr:YceD family protein [Lacticaseibacillus brantae]KRM72861.1 metal-binding protein [Lacticaseibacillus brantae DSM 23927]